MAAKKIRTTDKVSRSLTEIVADLQRDLDIMTAERDAALEVAEGLRKRVASKSAEPDEPDLDLDNAPKAPMVRTCQPFGGCHVLGPMTNETDRSFVYLNGEGQKITIKKAKKATHAGFPDPKPHILPCRSCKDHPETRHGPDACMHGNPRGEGSCERCLSM